MRPEPPLAPSVLPLDLFRLLSPLAPLRTLVRHRTLLKQLSKREVVQRYRGSYLGFFWSFLTPLANLAVYTFVFSVVLQARWRDLGEVSSSTSYALGLFAGLVPFNVFSEVANRAPYLILSSPNYVKKVLFPLELLPVVVLVSALAHAGAGLAILIAGTSVLVEPVSLRGVLLLPLALGPVVFLSLAAGWLLSSLGVFIRDVGHAVGSTVQLIMFLCPVVYPLSAVPERFRFLLFANPLTPTMETVRALILWKEAPPWGPLLIWTGITALAAWLSFAWFTKAKRGFADVL